MVIVAALLVAAAPSEPPPPPVQRVMAESQAVAMVRILPGAALKFGEIESGTPELLRDAQIRAADGSIEPARLVELE